MPRKTQVDEYKEKLEKWLKDNREKYNLCPEGLKDFCNEMGIKPPGRRVKAIIYSTTTVEFDTDVEIPDNPWGWGQDWSSLTDGLTDSIIFGDNGVVTDINSENIINLEIVEHDIEINEIDFVDEEE